MAFQVFISYARKDNLPPLGAVNPKGFVSRLREELAYEFERLGPPDVNLWRDTRSIAESDQFAGILEDALDASQVLLVILSRNWVSRPYCQAELARFAEKRSSAGDDAVKRNIVVVQLQQLDRPELLGGQAGYCFYVEDDETGAINDLLDPGEPQSRAYYDRVRALARDLWHRANGGALAPPAPAAPAPALLAPQPHSAAVRTIFLAKPAGDMRTPYLRLVDELTRRDYRVVPPPDVKIPEQDAVAYVDGALAEAEASIHVVGENEGNQPDENAAKIVKLQLARAGARATAAGADAPFPRLIWAPRVLLDDKDRVVAANRDPLAVLNRFDQQRATDKVDGSELSAFVEFVVQHLDRPVERHAVLDAIPEGAQVYVYHRPEDTQYALHVIQALRARGVEPMYPSFEGDPTELKAYHSEMLRECDAVVLCWANAAEVWVQSTAHELRDWHTLGRNEKFAYRGLIAGRPPGERKSFAIAAPPAAVDVVVDLTAQEWPTAELLGALIPPARAPAGAQKTAP